MVAEHEIAKDRLTPTLNKPIGKVYRPYYAILAVLGIGCFIGMIVCASQLKVYDSNIKDQLFHMWVAFPLLVPAICGFAVFFWKRRRLAILFLCLSVIVMILCGAASLLTGLRYWLDGWYSTRERLDASGLCRVTNNLCTCDGVSKMPLAVKTCSNMKTATNLLVGEIVLSALGFIINMAGVFLGFMTICCGPWQYIDDYSEEFDIDRNPNVEFRQGKSRPSMVGHAANQNRGFSAE